MPFFEITISLVEELLGNANPPTSEAGLHSRGFKRALKLEKLLNAAREAGMEGVAVKSGLSC